MIPSIDYYPVLRSTLIAMYLVASEVDGTKFFHGKNNVTKLDEVVGEIGVVAALKYATSTNAEYPTFSRIISENKISLNVESLTLSTSLTAANENVTLAPVTF